VRLIILALCLLCSSLVNAKCDIEQKDSNSKFEYVDLLLDVIGIIQQDTQEIYLSLNENSNSSFVNKLASLKQANSDYECAIHQLEIFGASNKLSIKKNHDDANAYLTDEIKWNSDLLDILNMKYGSDSIVIDNKVADLKNKQKELNKELIFFVADISSIDKFEQADDENVDMSKIPKDDAWLKLGIKENERKMIGKKISTIMLAKNSNTTILAALVVGSGNLRYTEPKVETLEAMSKYYK